MSEFVHLCCVSDRSIGHGLIKPSQLAAEYASRGAIAAAITDYGNMNASVQLHNACRANGLKPIYGAILNLVEDKSIKDTGYTNFCLIARNRTGFENLVKIVTTGSMYSYYVPRVDMHTLASYSAGLSLLTGGVKGVAAKQIFSSSQASLDPFIEKMSPIYGEHIYFEIRDEPTESQRVLNSKILEYASSGHSKVVANGMPYYLRDSDSDLHRTLYRARNHRSGTSNYPIKGPSHLKTRSEMRASLRKLSGDSLMGEIDKAIAMSDSIVDIVEDFDLRDGVKIPRYAG
jgi:DNA polymerase-3 subunit alpha